jgi:glycosyltransferase involved in cell wall biosynthesis
MVAFGLRPPMNILFCTVPFAPSVGGIETVSAILADEFVRQGHALTLVTQTSSPSACADDHALPYRVVRQPGLRDLAQLVRRADLVFQNNLSLRLAWPLMLTPRPWVVAHHMWLEPGAVGQLKRALLPTARHIACSHAMAASLPVASVVVPNPYRADLFKPLPGIVRDRDVVFVGRLIADKGVAVLLHALSLARQQGRALSATIIGDGPEGESLRRLSHQLGLDGEVEFAGRAQGRVLVERLHRHRFAALPSTWEEPFGVAALEAMACGCVPVASRSGGLPEAIGEAGVIVPRGDAAALAAALSALAGDPGRVSALRQKADTHLPLHRPDRIALRYLRAISHANGQHAAFAA